MTLVWWERMQWERNCFSFHYASYPNLIYRLFFFSSPMYAFQLVSSCGSHFPLLGGELMRSSITSQRKGEGERNLMETDEVMPVQCRIMVHAHTEDPSAPQLWQDNLVCLFPSQSPGCFRPCYWGKMNYWHTVIATHVSQSLFPSPTAITYLPSFLPPLSPPPGIPMDL